MPTAGFRHCENAYSLMKERSHLDEQGNTIYEGHLTKDLYNLGLSTQLYSQVTKDLKRMGCIEQLRRGTGAFPSEWLLLQTPTVELYEGAPAISNGWAKPREKDIMQREIRDLQEQLKKLGLLEARVERLENVASVNGGSVGSSSSGNDSSG